MRSTPLEVLVVLPDEGACSATAAALRRRGHVVAVVDGLEQAADHADAHVVVCDLPTLEGLRARGLRQRAIVLDLPETPDAWRAALRLGAADALARPWRLAQLVAAVEDGPRAPLPAAPGGLALRRSFEAEADAVEQALRELCAFLVRHGTAPAARARTLSACAELLENVLQHAYPTPGTGRVELSARLRAEQIEVEVGDRGAGFVVEGLPAEGGLARAAALTEDLRLTSEPGQGTRATLRVQAWRVDLDGDEDVDLSELDWLSPALARRVLASTAGGCPSPFFSLSPALAVTVGRLLAGASERQRAERSLWS
jgi:anti-sigma regulatory factor (Ser/Thr protein kinase)